MLYQVISTIWNRLDFRGVTFAVAGFVATSFFVHMLLSAPNDVAARNLEDDIMHGVVQATDLRTFGESSTVLDGAALMHATPNHIAATINATGLDPHSAYTVWAVVFNRPEHCTAGTDPRPDVMCGSPDLSLTPNMAEASSFHIGGFITTSDGMGQIDVALDSGPLPMGTDVLWGIGGINDNGVEPGLMMDNGLLAEIHFILRNHGPLITGHVAAQTSTLKGGCPPNTCTNQQAASFPPAGSNLN